METQTLISIDLIQANPYQPRQSEDAAAVAEIAASIKRHGLMQVPTARRVNGTYQLAFGHTRLAAFKLNGETEMPLIVRDLDDLQMFEFGVSENIKRRDLNPIEEARAMQRYMQDFNKNSVETGEFFNCSPEKVRSTVRLLNLPETLQDGVASGEITQNNARRLLTIQRVAPEEAEKVAKRLKGDADPDRIIGETLKDTGRSVEMWQRWQSGEPLAGSKLWRLTLPADKFPKNHLPELKAGDVARALEIKQEDLPRAPYITPGLTPLEYWIKCLRDDHMHWAGMISSGKTAPNQEAGESVSDYLIRTGAPADVIEKIAHLVNPPSCSACPFYAKVDSSHYCTFRTCHNRKTRAWEAHVIASASKRTSIAVYDKKTDGDSAYLSNYDDHDKKLFQAKHADLRLKKGTNWNQHFEGIPEGYSVVVVGDTLKQMRKTSKTNSNSYDTEINSNYYKEQKRLSQLREANGEALHTFLWNVATPVFLTVFSSGVNVEFLKCLADRFVGGVPAKEPEKKATKKERLEFYQRAILFQLLNVDMWDFKTLENNHAVRRFAKRLQGQATTWGVKLPKNWMDQATQADKAITVTTETDTEA